MTQKVNGSSKKSDIYEAYLEILEKYKQQSAQKLISDEKTLVQPERKVSNDVFDSIEGIKRLVDKQMTTLSTDLKNKMQMLEEVEANIKENKEYLEDVMKIKAQGESLLALVDMQTAKEQEFEEMIQSKKREQEQMEKNWEFKFTQKKEDEEHKREIKKAQEQRTFDEEMRLKKETLDANLKEAKNKLTEYEEAIAKTERLEKDISELEPKLKKEITNDLKKEFDIEKEFMNRNFEHKSQISQLEIKNLEEKIANLESENKQLQKIVDNMTSKIEQLAEKVVDGNRPVIYGDNKKGE